MRNMVGLAVITGVLALPLLAGAQDSDRLYASVRGNSRLPVVGFSWEGAPQPLGRVADMPKRPKGDKSVALQFEGGKKACGRLEQAKAEGQKVPRLRLRNEGKTLGMVLRRVSVVSVDCSANPWSVQLQAESLRAKRKK